MATKSADLLVKTFGPGKIEMPPGHPEIELGLVKLYRATGNRDYLDAGEVLRRPAWQPTDDRPKLFGEYSQDHKPLVRTGRGRGALGAGDVSLRRSGRRARRSRATKGLAEAVDRIWINVVDKKTYVTGGIGAKGQGEAFGKNYELPNRTAYCENMRQSRHVLLERPHVPVQWRREVHRRARSARFTTA